MDVGPLPRGRPHASSSCPAPGYVRERVHVRHLCPELSGSHVSLTGDAAQVDGYYEPLEVMMDGVGVESYSYGYAGYACGYTTSDYWPNPVYEDPAELHTRREFARLPRGLL